MPKFVCRKMLKNIKIFFYLEYKIKSIKKIECG